LTVAGTRRPRHPQRKWVLSRRANYVVCQSDSLDQAVEDLRREWGAERRELWAIDTERTLDDVLDRIEETEQERVEAVLDESILDPLHRFMRRQLDLGQDLER
jgi:hypothetical protein